MKQLNVLWAIDHVCYDGHLHGGGRLYWNVLPRLEEVGVRVIPCLLRATDEIRELFRDSPHPVRILDKGKFDPTTLTTFLRLIREEQVDVMHLHCYGASTFGRLANVVSKVPTIIHDYDTEVYFPYPWYLWAADKALASRTGYALAASPMVREFLIEKRKISPDRIKTFFHAIPRERFERVAPHKVNELRAELDLGPEDRVFGTVTKLGPQRGNDVLIQAAARLTEDHPEARFLVIYQLTRFHRLPNKEYVPVTEEDLEFSVAPLQDQVRALGLEKHFRFIEWPGNLREHIALFDAVVAPFQSERFSSVYLLESMAQGKPLVATALGEQKEIVTHGKDGLLVSPGEVEELAEGLRTFLDEPDRFRSMGDRARQRAGDYSIDAYVRRLRSLYEELAEGRAQPLKAARVRT
jgi:glycosyltransferase involved in cell wall biosynthesis